MRVRRDQRGPGGREAPCTGAPGSFISLETMKDVEKPVYSLPERADSLCQQGFSISIHKHGDATRFVPRAGGRPRGAPVDTSPGETIFQYFFLKSSKH